MPDHSADSAETQRLLMRICSGDRNAFNDLFDRHRNALRRAVQLRLDRQLRTRIDESDVVQDAQMEAFRRLDDYLERRPMPFGLWLRKTAQERIYNYRRAHLQTARRSVQSLAQLRRQSLTDARATLVEHMPERMRQYEASEAYNSLLNAR